MKRRLKNKHTETETFFYKQKTPCIRRTDSVALTVTHQGRICFMTPQQRAGMERRRG